MKSRILALAVAVLFSTGGWDCFNEGFVVPLDIKLPASFVVLPQNGTSFSGGTLIDITQYIDQSYQESVDSGRVYDLAVRAVGTYDGTVNGTAFINGYPLLTFTGTGTDFSTPQSLLGKSTHIALVSAGKNELLRVLGNVKANRFIQVSASGTLSKAVSQQITIYVEILTQFDATP